MLAKYFSVFIIIISLTGCNAKINETKKKDVKGNIESPIFIYDNVEYYYNQISETKIPELVRSKNKSQLDSLKTALLLYETPISINDTFFVTQLLKLKYRHRFIPRSSFGIIDSLFSTNHVDDDNQTCPSEIVYTDLLIFRKKSKISGFVKFSYGCSLYYKILGVEKNTPLFERNSIFSKLIELRP